MSTIVENLFKVSSTLLLTTLWLNHEVAANEPPDALISNNEALEILRDRLRLNRLSPPRPDLPRQKTFNASGEGMGQVTSVAELRDVVPTEWAYEALRSLVERYGCIVGYPDRTFRGNRALTRWEFAAGLNACLNTLERLSQENVAVLQEDINKLKRLAEEFQQELAALGAKVDNLETRVAYLEDHQFSTTTQLNGDAIFAYSGVWGQEQADAPKGTSIQNGQITGQYRHRMNWDTSFTGEDQLRIRLQTANFVFARGGSNLTDFNFSFNTDGYVEINKLQYRFPVTDSLTVWLNAAKLTLDDLSDPLAPFTNSFTEGALSFFGAIAPVYLLSDNTGPGAGVLYEFSESLSWSAYYSALNGSSPEPGKGLFNGQYVAGTQLTYLPAANTGVGLAYLRHYLSSDDFNDWSLLGFLGVANTDNPFRYFDAETREVIDTATASDNVALLWTWQLAQWISFEGWGMYTRAYAYGGQRNSDKADIWNWKASVAFPDLLGEGNVGVITVGQPPYAAFISNHSDAADAIAQTRDTPWLIETFYVWQINDNISITPGIWVAINPENDRAPLWVGAIRTSFKF